MLIGAGFICLWSHHSRITVRHGVLTVWRSVAGFASERAMPVSAIGSVAVSEHFQSGSTRYYRISIRTAEGKRIKAVGAMEGRAFVEELAAQMRSAVEGEKR